MKKDGRGRPNVAISHVLAFLEENKGTGKRFKEIHPAMYYRKYRHNASTVAYSLKWLVEQKKIVKVSHYYGVPAEREDGSKYLIVPGLGLKNDIAELE